MRKILSLVVIALTVVGFTAYAEFQTIRQDMIALERLAKTIRASVNDSSQNAQNAEYAGQIAQLFNATLNQVPPIIAQFPTSQQNEAYSNYQQYIQYGINLSLQLQQALQNNDNATAAALIQQMFQLKEESHQTFNP
ncbi:MAG: hypothetical protein J7501_04155 [Bdellovibrio sp.]|nr:hypothetical protein [Bdellovibrio sp.]